ncbi:conserved hypothetical protein, partial [Trichinella spiralis]|uniref:hypothetical protein n=1 Tax=Trichinella spiralis TaxID=6334 RepID=UPI0001EFEF48
MVQKNIFWTIHVAVVNGWLQSKIDLKTSEAASGSQKDLMQFTLDVAEALTKVNKAYARKSRGRVSVTANIETSRSGLNLRTVKKFEIDT